ncbi:MAG: hypothetical protein AAF916_07270 [Planctomycetota bacterium]
MTLLIAASIGCRHAPLTEARPVNPTEPHDTLLTAVSIDRRLEAADALDLREDEHWNAVSDVAWSGREPTRLRRSLLESLRQADRDRFWLDAQAHWPSERSNEIDMFLREASRSAGEPAAAALLLRWEASTPTENENRRLAEDWLIAQRADRTNAGAALSHLMDWLDSDRPWAIRVAAWRVAAGWHPRELIEPHLLQRFRSGNPKRLIADLRATVGVVGHWPTKGWELFTLRRMRSQIDAEGRTAWWRLAQRSMRLPRFTRTDVAIRHAAWLTTRPEGWTCEASAHDEPKKASEPNRLDAAVAKWLRDEISQAAIRHDLFAQADADHVDDQSEHGGLVMLDDAGRAALKSYPPVQRQHDRAYVAPPTLSLDVGNAVATYHFHAERYANREHAGPGFGDRRAVEASATLMVVFTFLDRDTLAVHVVAPGDQLFDLGVVRRP